jgi:hypothetical protein
VPGRDSRRKWCSNFWTRFGRAPCARYQLAHQSLPSRNSVVPTSSLRESAFFVASTVIVEPSTHQTHDIAVRRVSYVKIGRNALCQCGSGKKFKRCCGKVGVGVGSEPPKTPTLDEVVRVLAEKQRVEAERISRYGHVRAPVTVRHAGQAVVAVGNRVLTDKRWNSFHDFLFTYLGTLIDEDWFRAESARVVEERHPLMQWYQVLEDLGTWREHPRGELRKVSAPPALASALLSLSYELYLLENYGLLTPRLLGRLRRPEHFQGARYEIYVSAAFLRAGFDVELEDEDDRTTSHCEFAVTHRESGRKYSVEAKSRHRTGYLGVAGKRAPLDEIEASCTDLLVKALRKVAGHDRIVFIDVNVPPSEAALFASDWFKKIIYQLERLETKPPQGTPLPSAIVFFTNFPHHYIEGDKPLHGQTVTFTGFGMPEFRGATQDESTVQAKHPQILTLFESMLRHTAVPHELN